MEIHNYTLRISSAVKYKVPVLITVPYAVIYLGNVPPKAAFFYLLLSVITIIGVAGFGYLLNDWSDGKKDLVSKKPNQVNNLSFVIRLSLLAVFTMLAVMPWWLFPFTLTNVSLLIIELLLFAAYSLEPIRLKERPVIGIVTDSLYAHVLPVVLAALTFYEVARLTTSVTHLPVGVLIALALWQFSCGIRNILLHQMEDTHQDNLSGTITFATQYGYGFSEKLVVLFLVAELTFLVLLVTLVCLVNFWLGIGWLIAYLLFYSQLITKQQHTLATIHDSRAFAYRFVDAFYNQWFAWPVLILLCLQHPLFVILFAIHFIAFPNPAKQLLLRK